MDIMGSSRQHQISGVEREMRLEETKGWVNLARIT
jgi:hypothetical protein